LVEAVISSITGRRGDWVRWRPVLKQVLPWRSLDSAAEIDPGCVKTTAPGILRLVVTLRAKKRPIQQ
jgi:hypothetical protein